MVMNISSSHDKIWCYGGQECVYTTTCDGWDNSTDYCRLQGMWQQLHALFGGGVKVSLGPVKETTTTQTSLQESVFAGFKPNTFVPEISGEMLDDPSQRGVTTSDGRATKVASFRLTDGVTTIRVSVWEDLADYIMNFTAGDKITVTRIAVKKPYEGLIQVGSTRNTKITKTT